ncbi:uncharacterized protein TrAtP1_009702 [Trichoderma atroviride]|uniref:uncharacterized protein n=1 Tax=Hypocrea atroviridis TaxID=63577 RepID=UPI0033330A51|nr:hypothetical protein TrAtP1_009702 [Trichoderma atroviride]
MVEWRSQNVFKHRNKAFGKLFIALFRLKVRLLAVNSNHAVWSLLEHMDKMSFSVAPI